MKNFGLVIAATVLVGVTAYVASRSAPPAVGAGFSPENPTVNSAMSFFSTVSGGVPPYTYVWSGSDGLTGNLQSTSHTYATEGIYTATITVTDSAGNASTASVTVHVSGLTSNGNPTPSTAPTIAMSSGFVPDNPVGQAAVYGLPSGGTGAYAYVWTLDGAARNDTRNYIVVGPGSHTAVVTATSADGQTATNTIVVNVAAAPTPVPSSHKYEFFLDPVLLPPQGAKGKLKPILHTTGTTTGIPGQPPPKIVERSGPRWMKTTITVWESVNTLLPPAPREAGTRALDEPDKEF